MLVNSRSARATTHPPAQPSTPASHVSPGTSFERVAGIPSIGLNPLQGHINMNIRPRRSVLYMPGSNARAIEKARTLPADAVILDLEDSVAPDAKAAARQQVMDAVTAGSFGQREVFIRTNALDTPWG